MKTEAPPQSLLIDRPQDRKFFWKNFRLAFAIHTAFVLVVILCVWKQGLSGKKYIPSIKVDLVGLPDFKKSEKHLIHNSLQDLGKKLTEAESRSKKTLENLKKTAVEKTVAIPTQQKESKKPKKDRLSDAIERIRALKKMEDSQKPGSETIKGNLLNKGNSLTGDTNENIDLFGDQMRQKLNTNWDLPVWLSKQTLSAQVTLKLDSNGFVIGTQFEKTSGNEQFDAYVLKTIKASQPFGQPPQEILDGGVTLGFPL